MKLIDGDYAESLLLMHENNTRAAGKDKEADGLRTAYADIAACCKPIDAVPWDFLERYAVWFCADVSFPEFIREAKSFYKSKQAAMNGGTYEANN